MDSEVFEIVIEEISEAVKEIFKILEVVRALNHRMEEVDMVLPLGR